MYLQLHLGASGIANRYCDRACREYWQKRIFSRNHHLATKDAWLAVATEYETLPNPTSP
ncbi:hypothetical protein [Nostoc sp. T09]|uniref:hypothetical protein n=1 Tax=Nostoc sp. T09 TaxID=1932621 RepID=UPI0015C4E97F|nr:hypothetical protein [Nostoc sp. T09]